jgi:hypothetical protein
MLDVASKFLRQIVPPVIATLIAAMLIAGFNRAFSTHLSQPRLGGMNAQANAEEPVERAQPRRTVRYMPIELVDDQAPAREWQKGGTREAAKDPVAIKAAETAPAAPPAPVVTRRSEPRQVETRQVETRQPEPRQIETRQVDTRQVDNRPAEPRRVEQHVIAAPVVAAPPPVAPVVVAVPPAAPVVIAAPVAPQMAPAARQDVVSAEPPMVTVPDRQRPQSQSQPQYDPYAQQPPQSPPQPQGPIGTIAKELSPATWFARARELGDRIEAVGNEILPNIRQ